MALKALLDTLDGLADPIKALYVAKDGKFALDVDGAVSATELAAANAKTVEFRDKNIALLRERDELLPLKDLKAKFDGIDPEAAKDAIAKVAALKKKGVGSEDDVASVVNAAIAAALKPVTDKLAATEATSAANAKRADESTLRAVIGEKFGKAGGEPGALDFIVGKAAAAFVIENGVLKAAPNTFSTAKPGEPLGVDEWLTGQVKDAAFAFKPSSGAGADPKPGGGGTLKPGQTVLKNPTAQELGAHANDIRSGKVRIEMTPPA